MAVLATLVYLALQAQQNTIAAQLDAWPEAVSLAAPPQSEAAFDEFERHDLGRLGGLKACSSRRGGQ